MTNEAMSDEPTPNGDQRINISDSSIDGQIGQAGRDVRQFQFIFWRRKSNPQQEGQNRQVLLDKVRNFWVKGVLEELSHGKLALELSLEERLDALEQSWGMVYETPEQLRQALPLGTRVINLFDQLGEGGTLLILGEPGSGKTRTLLELTREFINRAKSSLEYPLPAVFNLSSWKGGNQTIADWLIQQLQERYQISKALSKTWVKDEHLLLLLDGLNEVRPDRQDACVLALNQFIHQHGKTETIVCSRARDYEALSKRLKFQGAIYIKPTTS